MRKYIAILILVSLGVILFVVFDNQTSEDNEEKSLMTSGDRLLDDLKEDYEGTLLNIRDLQKTPQQVIKFNNTVMKKLYGHDISEDDIELLLKVQRVLYDEELLEKNPKDVHYQRAKEEIQAFEDSDTKIIGYDIQEDQQEKDGMVMIKVVFYLNKVGSNGEIYEEFLLVEKEGLWKIKGWQTTQEFIVVGD
ncbi:hypothetical protein HZI73_22630 [Vallitalea pronyensis]|uniref:Uncharacterized protein n=1 Tax=Vallitalea pronyensis TaxID=1348613 RepID=A0A8J8SIG6_9FIRM|nr:DUF6715 family protein [Vallitalea pronyensis]QUI24910.1 hypothetical protein HZI73_22630 [Vallitalea pronyensis]